MNSHRGLWLPFKVLFAYNFRALVIFFKKSKHWTSNIRCNSFNCILFAFEEFLQIQITPVSHHNKIRVCLLLKNSSSFWQKSLHSVSVITLYHPWSNVWHFHAGNIENLTCQFPNDGFIYRYRFTLTMFKDC